MECSCNLAVMQYSNWSWTATRCNPARSTSRVQLISSSRAVIICSEEEEGISSNFESWTTSLKFERFQLLVVLEGSQAKDVVCSFTQPLR